MTMFELYLAYTNISIKKRSCKEGLVGFDGPRGLEIIFALLTEVVAVHV